MSNLSENFTLQEMTRSSTAVRLSIDNRPDDQQMENLKRLCVETLEPVKTLAGGKRVRVSSGLRVKLLNQKIGGSKSSDHVNGNASDFTIEDMTVTEVVEMIMNSDIPFDQLIHEFDSWVHISNRGAGNNRRQVLRATKVNGKTVYEKYV